MSYYSWKIAWRTLNSAIRSSFYPRLCHPCTQVGLGKLEDSDLRLNL